MANNNKGNTMNNEQATQALDYLEEIIPTHSMYAWFVAELINIYNDSIAYEYQMKTTGENEALSESILRTKEILRGFVLSLVTGGFNTEESNLGEINRAFNTVWDFHVIEGNMRGYMQYESQRKRVDLTA
jgi:hypothetical protein